MELVSIVLGSTGIVLSLIGFLLGIVLVIICLYRVYRGFFRSDYRNRKEIVNNGLWGIVVILIASLGMKNSILNILELVSLAIVVLSLPSVLIFQFKTKRKRKKICRGPSGIIKD